MKLAIFEMDGVLAETEPIYERMYRKIYRRFGHELPQAEREHFIGRSSKHIWSFVKEKYALTESVDELIRM